MASDDDFGAAGTRTFESGEEAAPPALPNDWYGTALQRVWLSAQALQWRSLALVPASDDVSVIELAHAFSALGLWNCGEATEVVDLRNVPFPNLRGPIEVIKWHIRGGGRVILALSSCSHSVATVPLAQAADCCILCVALGSTRIAEASEAVEQVGPDHFVGTLLVRPRRRAVPVAASNGVRLLRG
jgi:hypothetical protein